MIYGTFFSHKSFIFILFKVFKDLDTYLICVIMCVVITWQTWIMQKVEKVDLKVRENFQQF